MWVVGCLRAAVASNSGLARTFSVLSSSVDREGKPYVAQVEAKELPIYGNQFHPEKVQFVHSRSDPDIPRGPHAIALSRHDTRCRP